MNVDVLIYVNTLKEFFKKDKQAFKDMFGTLDIDKKLYFQRLTEIATYNLNNSGIPTLSTVQMFDIVKELTQSMSEFKKLTTAIEKEQKGLFFKIIDGFPPICLN